MVEINDLIVAKLDALEDSTRRIEQVVTDNRIKLAALNHDFVPRKELEARWNELRVNRRWMIATFGGWTVTVILFGLGIL